MDLSSRQRSDRELAVAFVGGALLLIASLANFLNYNAYPIFRPEVGIVTLALLCLAAAMAPFYVAQRRWGKSFLQGLLALLFTDLNTDSLALACALGAAIGLVSWLRRFSFLPAMAIIGAVTLATKATGLGGSPSWIKVEKGAQAKRPTAGAEDNPAIVHIIFDEHIGLEGLRNEGSEAERLSDELRTFYLTNGFAIYGGAYSRHFNTINAIPDALNYGTGLGASPTRDGVIIGPTKYLQALGNRGYRITVFQSDYADYCTGAHFYECLTYDSSSLLPTLAAPLAIEDRAALITLKFLRLSDVSRLVTDAWDLAIYMLRPAGLQLPLHNGSSEASSTVATLEAMKLLDQRLKSIRRGDAVFAHLIAPHHPYVTRRDCTYLPWSEWESLTSGSSVEVRRAAYNEQLRCTTRQVDAIIHALAASKAGINTILILQGDHGSRITRQNPNQSKLGLFDDADAIAGFSTLFAIRAAGVAPGYFTERQPIPALLRDFANSGFRTLPHPEIQGVPFVYLADENWKPARRVPLAPSWVGLDASVSEKATQIDPPSTRDWSDTSSP